MAWVYELPVGRGKAFAGTAGRWLDALVGGWQVSGLNRWTSGLPFSVQKRPGLDDQLEFPQQHGADCPHSNRPVFHFQRCA